MIYEQHDHGRPATAWTGDQLCDVRILVDAASTRRRGLDMTMSPPASQGFLGVAPVSPFLDSIRANQLWYSGLGWGRTAADAQLRGQTSGSTSAQPRGSGSAAPRSIFVYADSVRAISESEHGRGTRTRGLDQGIAPAWGPGADPVISPIITQMLWLLRLPMDDVILSLPSQSGHGQQIGILAGW